MNTWQVVLLVLIVLIVFYCFYVQRKEMKKLCESKLAELRHDLGVVFTREKVEAVSDALSNYHNQVVAKAAASPRVRQIIESKVAEGVAAGVAKARAEEQWQERDREAAETVRQARAGTLEENAKLMADLKNRHFFAALVGYKRWPESIAINPGAGQQEQYRHFILDQESAALKLRISGFDDKGTPQFEAVDQVIYLVPRTMLSPVNVPHWDAAGSGVVVPAFQKDARSFSFFNWWNSSLARK